MTKFKAADIDLPSAAAGNAPCAAPRKRLKPRLRGSVASAASALLAALLMGAPGVVFAQGNPQAAAQPTDQQTNQPQGEAAQPTLPGGETGPQPSYVGLTSQDVGVMDRQRPEFDAKGIPLGGFRLFPVMTAGVSYDDNVRRTQSAVSDWYFEEAPAVRLQSQWGRHFLEVYGGLDNFNYAQDNALSLTDWNIGADGRYDISRAAVVTALGSYGEYHEGLESPNTVGGQAAPTRYFRTHGEMTALYQPDRLGFGLGASIDRFNWGITPLIGGATFSNADRDETEYQLYAKALYDFSPGYSGFVKVLYDGRDFDQFYDRSGLHRASSGLRFDGGVDLQISHLLSGEVFLGYLEQHYAQYVALPLSNVSGVDFGVKLDWFASPLLTVHLTGQRQVNDITIYQAAATDDKIVKLSADYEFRRDVIFQGYFSYTNSSFIGLSRQDNYPSLGIKARYLVNSYMSADLGYNYSERSSNIPFVSFNDDTLTLALNLHI